MQATAAGLAVALGGVIRDVLAGLGERQLLTPALNAPATAYTAVYTLEVVLLLATVAAMAPLLRRAVHPLPT